MWVCKCLEQLDWSLNGLHHVQSSSNVWLSPYVNSATHCLENSTWASSYHVTGAASMCCEQSGDFHGILFVSCRVSCMLCRCYPSPKPNWKVRTRLTQTVSGLWHVWKGNFRQCPDLIIWMCPELLPRVDMRNRFRVGVCDTAKNYIWRSSGILLIIFCKMRNLQFFILHILRSG